MFSINMFNSWAYLNWRNNWGLEFQLQAKWWWGWLGWQLVIVGWTTDQCIEGWKLSLTRCLPWSQPETALWWSKFTLSLKSESWSSSLCWSSSSLCWSPSPLCWSWSSLWSKSPHLPLGQPNLINSSVKLVVCDQTDLRFKDACGYSERLGRKNLFSPVHWTNGIQWGCE